MGLDTSKSIRAAAASPLTIGQLARRFKVSLQTLYFYEQQGLLAPDRSGGSRSYDEADVKRLAFVLDKRRLGMSLAQIALLLTDSELCICLFQLLTDQPPGSMPFLL